MCGWCRLLEVEEEEGDSNSLELELPSFPAPPKRDAALLRMDLGSKLDAHFAASEELDSNEFELPRFRAAAAARMAAEGESDESESETESEEEEQTETEASDESESAEVEEMTAAEEEQTEQSEQSEQAEEDESAEAESEESEAEESESEEEESDEPMRFVQSQPNPQAMRFARLRAGGYDGQTLPSGPVPLPLSNLATAADPYLRAHVRPSSLGQAVFQPIHNAPSQFPGTRPVANLAASRDNYAWAVARPPPSAYVYGNTNYGAPINAGLYNPPSFASAVPLAPAASASLSATVPHAPPAPMPAAPSFAEIGAASSAAAPFRSISQNAWPSAIPPPAAYYLPANLVV